MSFSRKSEVRDNASVFRGQAQDLSRPSASFESVGNAKKINLEDVSVASQKANGRNNPVTGKRKADVLSDDLDEPKSKKKREAEEEAPASWGTHVTAGLFDYLRSNAVRVSSARVEGLVFDDINLHLVNTYQLQFSNRQIRDHIHKMLAKANRYWQGCSAIGLVTQKRRSLDEKIIIFKALCYKVGIPTDQGVFDDEDEDADITVSIDSAAFRVISSMPIELAKRFLDSVFESKMLALERKAKAKIVLRALLAEIQAEIPSDE